MLSWSCCYIDSLIQLQTIIECDVSGSGYSSTVVLHKQSPLLSIKSTGTEFRLFFFPFSRRYLQAVNFHPSIDHLVSKKRQVERNKTHFGKTYLIEPSWMIFEPQKRFNRSVMITQLDSLDRQIPARPKCVALIPIFNNQFRFKVSFLIGDLHASPVIL